MSPSMSLRSGKSRQIQFWGYLCIDSIQGHETD